MTTPTFGVTVTRTASDTMTPIWTDFSVIGLIGTAADANAAAFPLDEPVLLYSNDNDKLALLGTDGTLYDAVKLINAQLNGGAAKIVVVRIAEGASTAETIANAVGDGLTTGINAFLDAPALLGVTPRLIGAPGLTGYRAELGTANALCAALPAVLASLLAHAVIDAPGNDEANDLDWRETLASERLIPVSPAVIVDSDGLAVTVPGSPAILGIAVRRDNEAGGLPFASWANQPVYGITKLARPIRFNLYDGANEGQTLLANNIGIIVRSEKGVAGGGEGGFRYYGTDNTGTDELWNFYNVTRGRDYINLMCMDTVAQYLGKYNLTGQTVQSILNTLNGALSSLKAAGAILDFAVSFTEADNPTADLREGRLTVQFNAEESPVLRRIGIKSGRMATAVDAVLESLAA